MRYNKKITPELITHVSERVSEGEDITRVAQAVGIARSTLYYWLSRGASSRSGVYRQFFREYRRARAAYESSIIHVVIDGTKTRNKEKTLAAKLKITPRTWQNWKVRGESEASGFYHDLVAAIEKVRFEARQAREKEWEQILKSRNPVTVSEARRALARLSPDVWGEL